MELNYGEKEQLDQLSKLLENNGCVFSLDRDGKFFVLDDILDGVTRDPPKEFLNNTKWVRIIYSFGPELNEYGFSNLKYKLYRVIAYRLRID